MESQEVDTKDAATLPNGDISDEKVAKHDDFFDDAPPKQTGEAAVNEPDSTSEQVAPAGDSEAAVNGEEAGTAQDVPDSGAAEETEEKKEEKAEEERVEGDGGSEEKEESEEKESSPTADEAAPVDAESGAAEIDSAAPAEGGTDEPTDAEAGGKREDVETPEKDATAGEEKDGQEQEPAEDKPEVATPEVKSPDTLQVREDGEGEGSLKAPPSREEDYEDDFSLASDKPASPAVAVAAEPKVEEEEEQSQKPEGEEGAGQTPAVDDHAGTESPDPGSIRADSRAEAAAVVPVPVEETKKPTDGRSSAEPPEQGDRGEDRMEEKAPEGSEDCRGAGQWRPEEQQMMATAVMAQKSDREALEAALEEKDKVMQEYADLKLQHDTDIKDLQERLAVLSRENQEKDKRIFELEESLQDTTNKLRETERKLFDSETSHDAAGETPKSKTCSIM